MNLIRKETHRITHIVNGLSLTTRFSVEVIVPRYGSDGAAVEISVDAIPATMNLPQAQAIGEAFLAVVADAAKKQRDVQVAWEDGE